MNYIERINNHIKLEFEDIKQFCLEQIHTLKLENYVSKVEIDKIPNCIATYIVEKKKICISDNLDKYFKDYKKEKMSNNPIDKLLCNYNDLYNLFIIETIFHELWHAKQIKELKENSSTDYSIFIKTSYNYMRRSGSMYQFYHDRYYHEYDAIINSILLTLKFTSLLNLDKRTLYLLNKSFSNEIINSYGLNNDIEYNSPLMFLGYLSKYLENDKDTSIRERISESLVENQSENYGIENLLKGYNISIELIETIKNIKNGNIKTINIIETIKRTLKESNNMKHIHKI